MSLQTFGLGVFGLQTFGIGALHGSAPIVVPDPIPGARLETFGLRTFASLSTFGLQTLAGVGVVTVNSLIPPFRARSALPRKSLAHNIITDFTRARSVNT